MDYSDFDYKTACKEYSMKKLEFILFKSRCKCTMTVINECGKKYGPDDLLSFLILGTVSLGFYIFMTLYFIVDGLFYLLSHKEKDKTIARYSEIKWDKHYIDKVTGNDDGYTTLGDIQRLADITEEIEEKIIEKCQQENHVEDIYKDKNAGEIIKDCKENAKRELKMALQMDDDDFKKYFYSGRAYCCIGNYKEAVENLEIACKTDNNDAWSFYWCGKAYYELKDYKNAIKKLERACKLDNNEHEFFYECGRVYYENENYIKAIEKLEKACELDDSDYNCFHLCGEVYLRLGENEKAFEKFDKNIKSE